MSKRGNFGSNRGHLRPDTNFTFGGLSLPEKEAPGTCSECGEEKIIFPDTGRCKDCEIREIAKYLASQRP
jgi:hypothetical protein